MKKVLLCIAAFSISFATLAGGGGPSWRPSVTPARCVNKPSPQEPFKWRSNIKECQDVITKGYASGVFVSGVAVYKGGQITYSYSANVTPSHGPVFAVPKEINGQKFVGIGQTNYQWIK